jgi:hypothetical protein
MATLNDTFSLRNNSHLLNRVAAALAKAAEAVRNEAAATPNHAQRFTWAIDVLLGSGPEAEASRAIWLVIQNTAIADNYVAAPDTGGVTSDGDVEFVVNSLVNILAGVDEAV